jgi:aldose 1-epimerase
MSPTFAPPSGEQHEIIDGSQRAIVTEVGAALRVYTVDGADVIDGFAIGDRCSAGRGQVLAPWPNRLADGQYSFEGKEARAALDEPQLSNAIHGLVRWLPWRVISQSAGAVELGCILHPQPGYPWRLELRIEYALSGPGLTVTGRATNLTDAAAPFGTGFHPYLTVATPTVDTASLLVPARRRLLADSRGLPTGETEVAGTEFDFGALRPIGPQKLDTCFTELTRGDDGRTSTHLEGQRGGVMVWADSAFGYFMVFTGDTLDPERRRRSVAIEPMTCPPNAFRSGTDLIRLEPGMSWRGSWGITPHSS